MQIGTAIVGGGLGGLATLERLLDAEVDAHLFEARDRFGGRILTEKVGGAIVDLGPSWFWPGQLRIAALLRRLGLQTFEQHAEGDLVVEDVGGVRRVPNTATMAGALRVEGGMGAIVAALVACLPQERLHIGVRVMALCADGRLALSSGVAIHADRIIIALPPRIAATLSFDPPLGGDLHRAMAVVPTWMAGQAKFVAVYEGPFWRAKGLNGDAISRIGPLAEIHDASPMDDARGALFGFVGLDAPARSQQGAGIERAAVVQLVRLFGEAAAHPIATRLVDWADGAATATPADRASSVGHPRYSALPIPSGAWQQRLAFAGTEQASANGGLLEGALEVADRIAHSYGPTA